MLNNWKKNTALFLSGQALSLFGSMLVQYTIMWRVLLQTQSGSMMSLFAIAGFLPMFVISPFSGIWADRFNRKNIINISDGGIALTSLIAAVLLFGGQEHIGILFCCAAIRSFGQGVQTPAVGAFIPQIVPAEHLTKINGIQTSIQSICMTAAPMISAALMAVAPLEMFFLLDVVTALISIVILFFFVKTPKAIRVQNEMARNENQKSVNYFRDLKDGLKYIRKHGFILRMIFLSAAFSILSSPAAFLLPLQVTRNFGEEVWRLSLIEIAFSVGMVLGGIFIGFWSGFKNRVYTMAFAAFLFGLESIAFGVIPHFWIYIAIIFIAGITFPFFNTPSMVILQSKVEPAFMGRVISVFSMTGSAMTPIGMLFFGPLADIISLDFILIGTGALIFLLGIPFLTSRQLQKAGRI